MQCILAYLGCLGIIRPCFCFELAVRVTALRWGRLSSLCCWGAVLFRSGTRHQEAQVRQHLIECAGVLILEDAAREVFRVLRISAGTSSYDSAEFCRPQVAASCLADIRSNPICSVCTHLMLVLQLSHLGHNDGDAAARCELRGGLRQGGQRRLQLLGERRQRPLQTVHRLPLRLESLRHMLRQVAPAPVVRSLLCHANLIPHCLLGPLPHKRMTRAPTLRRTFHRHASSAADPRPSPGCQRPEVVALLCQQ